MPFPTVTKKDIYVRLNEVGVKKGDLIYVASFMPILGNSPTILDDTIDALKEAVGNKGTIVMPVFNWDYCSGSVFDHAETPSQVGVLTEAFRQRINALRSYTPPWGTFAVMGDRAKEIISIRGTSSFGSDGITQYLYDHNARYVLIGCRYNDAVIHVHWLEEKYEVPYRYWKQFRGKIRINNKVESNVSYMYARKMELDVSIDSHHLTDKLEKTGKVKVVQIGLGELRSFLTKDYVEFITPYFKKDPLAVLNPEAKKYFK